MSNNNNKSESKQTTIKLRLALTALIEKLWNPYRKSRRIKMSSESKQVEPLNYFPVSEVTNQKGKDKL